MLKHTKFAGAGGGRGRQGLLRHPPVRNLFLVSAVDRGGNLLNGSTDFRTENGSSQGLNLAVTVLFVPNSLDVAG